MMNGYAARLLPPDEWHRLGLPPTSLPRDPARALIVVVEDGAGEIVGRWFAYETIILEGLFIESTHRKRPGVAGTLFQAMTGALIDRAVPQATTLIQDPGVELLASRHGFRVVPGHLWSLDLRSPPSPSSPPPSPPQPPT